MDFTEVRPTSQGLFSVCALLLAIVFTLLQALLSQHLHLIAIVWIR